MQHQLEQLIEIGNKSMEMKRIREEIIDAEESTAAAEEIEEQKKKKIHRKPPKSLFIDQLF